MTVTPIPELYWLILVTLLTAALWMPFIIGLLLQMGLVGGFSDPYHETVAEAAWVRRAQRGHRNAVENLVVFGILVLILQVLGLNTVATLLAAQIFFFSRLTHFIVYLLAIPWIRVAMFLVGFGCQIFIGYTILQGIG